MLGCLRCGKGDDGDDALTGSHKSSSPPSPSPSPFPPSLFFGICRLYLHKNTIRVANCEFFFSLSFFLMARPWMAGTG